MNEHETECLVQYIIVRNELRKLHSKALNTLVAASSTAAIHLYSASKQRSTHLGSLDTMGSIVLHVKSEDELKVLEEKLFQKDIDYKIWASLPERYPTCISLRPYPNTNVEKYLKQLSN